MTEQTKIDTVREGMEVYDCNGTRVGKIVLVHDGAGQMADVADIMTVKDFVDKVLECMSNLPSVVYPELFRVGFIRVGRGLIRSDVIVLPSQILDAGEETVFLNVSLGELHNC